MKSCIFYAFIIMAFTITSLVANAVGTDDTRPAEFKLSDEELNKTYKTLISRLSPQDKKKLQSAQKAWLKFRDIDCEWAFGAEKYDCLIDRTDNRTRELESTLFFDSKGSYESLK